MTLPELLQAARAGAVSELELISLEGGIYLLQILGAEQRVYLRDEAGRNLHLRSVEHARDLLEELPQLPLFLVHASAYDEMCGLPTGTRDALRVPVGLRSRW
ncbi:DUF6482 family protein [Pseudomonas sp. WHRI 8822A]|uniref:DUF6482 family protein n=1 Tax=Pseudomonas sp. WHRI 8822A TaxID=3162568 RepID=UPI0032EC4447